MMEMQDVEQSNSPVPNITLPPSIQNTAVLPEIKRCHQ